MKSLYKVKLKRTTYNGQVSTETRELFAESPSQINKYRLGGFQADSIEILSARKIRDRNIVEIEGNVERNELSVSIDTEEHLENTMIRANDIENLAAEEDLEVSEYLESIGYVEKTSDNTYNYCSDFSDEVQFTVFDLETAKRDNWCYSDTAILVARVHHGLDVRGGYGAERAYRRAKFDGFGYFLEFHVRFEVLDSKGDYVETFDGDGAAYSLLKEYQLVSVDAVAQEIKVSKNGEIFSVSFSHPSEY